MTKRYEVRGMMEWHPVFRVGRSRLRVSFTGGHLSAGGCTPASFETSDPVLQKVIETSKAFRTGQIMEGGHPDRCVVQTSVGIMEGGHPDRQSVQAGVGVMEGGHPDRRAVQASVGVMEGGHPDRQADSENVFEYTDIEELADFLHYRKGVPLERFDTPDAILLEARSLGIAPKKKEAPKS